MQWITVEGIILILVVGLFGFVVGTAFGIKRNLDTLRVFINRIELSIETINSRLGSLQNSLSHLEGRVQGHFEAKSVKQIESIPRIEVKRRRKSKPNDV